MEKVKENISATKSAVQVKRLSIVDSIDSLSLFSYNSRLELINYFKVDKSSISITEYLKNIIKEYGDIDFRLYYTSNDFEILPRNLFLYGKEGNYIKQIGPIAKKGSINFVDRCSEEQVVIIYPVSTIKDIMFREVIRGLHTYHIASAFIKSTDFKDNIIYLYTLGIQLFHYYRINGKLQFLFDDTITSENDLKSNVYKMLNLYADTDLSIVLCGELKYLTNKEWILNEPKVSLFSHDESESLSCIKY